MVSVCHIIISSSSSSNRLIRRVKGQLPTGQFTKETSVHMDKLPIELYDELVKYLGTTDLKNLRLTNRKWNYTGKNQFLQRSGQLFNVTFTTIETLIKFNSDFVNHQPEEGDLQSGKFTFMLPVLTSAEGLSHFETFGQAFGHLITYLALNFKNGHRIYGVSPSQQNYVHSHVTVLLACVKDQVEELQLQDYLVLDPSVLGAKPFPCLTKLRIHNRSKEMMWRSEESDYRRSFIHQVDTMEEACILELSQKVPAIEKFAFEGYYFFQQDSPSCLPTILGNIAQSNPNVLCNLEFRTYGMADSHPSVIQFLNELYQTPVKIAELSRGDFLHDQQDFLHWISGQGASLKKLTCGSYIPDSPIRLKLPPLPFLEELKYTNYGGESLLRFKLADRYPKLRKVTMSSTEGNDFIVPQPTVTELSILSIGDEIKGGNGLAGYLLAIFPNVTTLTIDQHPGQLDIFWKNLAQAVPQSRWDKILAIPNPTLPKSLKDDKGSQSVCFKDLKGLKELIVVIHVQKRATDNLDLLLYISKVKKLQRLQKLSIVIDLGEFGEDDANFSVPEIYVEELKKYHDDWSISTKRFVP